MNESPFAVSIVDQPALSLCGLFVRTSMQKASEDCPRLWERDFCPRMPEISQKPLSECQGESYGISVMDTSAPQAFTYWAAMPLNAEAPLPQGMSRIELRSGRYARCRVPSLQQLGDAYTYMYMRWNDPDGACKPDMTQPCFECYGAEYLANGALEVFMPLRDGNDSGE